MKNKIKQLLAENKIKQAIKLLSDSVIESDNRDFFDEVIILSGRYSRLQKEMRINVISHEQAMVENAKLLNALLELTYYIFDLDEADAKGKKRKLREAKVIFVGSGNVGKTSLINMLLHGNYNPNELKTEGISIKDLSVSDEGGTIDLHFWDFGGQEIMHATHKFFMTQRSLYVIVVNPREEDRYGEVELDYWLKLVQSYAPESPVIVVLNKCDVHKPNIDRRTYKINYSNIVDFIETSCLSNLGIEKLRLQIEKSIRKLPHLDVLVPESYLLIKNKLSQLKEDFISFHDYARICKSIDKKFEDDSMGALVGLLHDIGIILNFRDDLRLEQTQVLNPEWATKGVYGIVNSRALLQNKGILSVNELSNILDNKRYPRSQHFFLIDLMEKFELCYRMPDSKSNFLVPVAFGAERPESILWTENQALNFEYHYDILPHSVISRFIVRVHAHIEGNKYWKDGVVISKDEVRAFVFIDASNQTLKISIKGNKDRTNLLAYVRHHINDIHMNYNALEIQEKVPYEGVLIDYADLLICKEMGENEILIPKLRKKVNVIDLLEGIEEEKSKLSMDDIFNEFGDIFDTNTPSDKSRKILFLASNPSDSGRLRLGAEIREIEEGLRRSRNRDNFELIQKFAVRPTDLRRAILNDMPNIIHFSGHGDSGINEGIILEDDLGESKPVKGKSLANLFKLFSDEIECVILNSCYSQVQADEVAKYIPYVIGMSNSVTDKAAIYFAIAFYDAIGQNRDYEFAFAYAKNSIELEGLSEEEIPVLLKKKN